MNIPRWLTHQPLTTPSVTVYWFLISIYFISYLSGIIMSIYFFTLLLLFLVSRAGSYLLCPNQCLVHGRPHICIEWMKEGRNYSASKILSLVFYPMIVISSFFSPCLPTIALHVISALWTPLPPLFSNLLASPSSLSYLNRVVSTVHHSSYIFVFCSTSKTPLCFCPISLSKSLAWLSLIQTEEECLLEKMT